jgi:hypothetical protein
MSRRRRALGAIAFAVAAGCAGTQDSEEQSSSVASSALTTCSEWPATWAQGSGANNWWIEYVIGGGTVASATLDIVGGASVPLETKWGKWSASTAKIATGASVSLRAVDTAGRTARSVTFRYLVDTAPPSATACSTCTTSWNPAWAQGSGANNWWVEYTISGNGSTVGSAYLEVPGTFNLTLGPHYGKWAASSPRQIATGTSVVLHATNTAGATAKTQPFGYLVNQAPVTADACGTPPPPPSSGAPDTFATGEVDVVSVVKTAEDRRAISPLIYGLNSTHNESEPADVMRGVTFVRRGGDRSNTYNWENNLSNASRSGNFVSDDFLARNLANPTAPGELDRVLIANDRAAGRGTLVPFVLNDYVTARSATNIPWDQPGWNIDYYFHRVGLVKPTAFATTPDPNDDVVYTDEHIDFLHRAFSTDIFAPGPSQVMVGSDNEPDLYAENLPFLQRGTGRALYAPNGVLVGHYVTGDDFTARYIRFAKRVKSLWPTAPIVGPDHYHFDGYTTWWGSMLDRYSDGGRWYMDDFLANVRQASTDFGARLLDIWDFHWYPQRIFNGTFTWALDNSKRTMTQEEIDAVVQGPRSYWDTEYDEHSWITDDHLHGPAYIVTRLQARIAAAYPGTKIGITEYFPGGCSHVSSALGVVDTLGVFARQGVNAAAMWPHSCDLRFAFGGFKLVRNADGNGLRFAGTVVRVEHPEKVASSLYAGSDDASRVTVLVVNKTGADRTFGIRLYNATRLATVDVYRVDAGHMDPFRAATASLTKNNAYAYRAPPMSATLLVFRTP